MKKPATIGPTSLKAQVRRLWRSGRAEAKVIIAFQFFTELIASSGASSLCRPSRSPQGTLPVRCPGQRRSLLAFPRTQDQWSLQTYLATTGVPLREPPNSVIVRLQDFFARHQDQIHGTHPQRDLRQPGHPTIEMAPATASAEAIPSGPR